MQKLLLAIVATMIALAAWAALRPQDPYAIANPDPNHTHADFAVWVNGEQMKYDGEEFMSEAEDEETDEDHEAHGHKHHPYLHLHDGQGHVIHRHKPGISVGEFFQSLQLDFDTLCYISTMPMADGQICGETPFRMFVNGEERLLDPDYVFEDLDQILFTNAATDAQVQKELEQMTEDACLYSQRCPWKGEPPEENCIADPAVPCIE